MVAKNTKKTPQESEGKQPEPATKRAPAKRPTSTKPAPAKQPKSPKKKPSKRIPTRKVRKGKIQFDLVDEEEDIQQETEPQGEGDDPVLELAKKLSLDSLQEKGEGEGVDADFEREIRKLPDVEGKGKAIVTEEQVAHSLIDLSKKKKRTESGTEATAPKVDKERGEEASTTVTSEERMAVRAEDQAGSNPRKGNESTEDQAGPDPGESHAALAGPDPEPMHDDFYAMAYPDNLDDTDTFGDQFLNDKPTEDDQDKSNVEAKILSIILDPSHQTDTPAPPVSTPVIDISSLQPSSHVNAPLLTATTETTTTILALPPPPPSQSAMDSGLAARVDELEKRNAELEREYRIENYVRDAMKDYVQAALRAPLL
ncbi:hypothetical protein Tco_0936542 [Tanacetum coccineum]